jgi:hypothetical protein
MPMMWQANPHQYGPGKVHAIKTDDDGHLVDVTRCGKPFETCPGMAIDADPDDITCQGCQNSLEAERRHEEQQRQWEQQRAERARAREQENARWWQNYDTHLGTHEWRHRAALVMRRAGTICEGCGENPATAVHHLSYESYNRLGREFLWELAAICDDCHGLIHPHLRSAA